MPTKHVNLWEREISLKINSNLELQYISLLSATFTVVVTKNFLEAFCWCIRECCSHNGLFVMWLSAIFPSLHHGPKTLKSQRNHKPIMDLLCAICCIIQIGLVGGMLSVMSWGNFHYLSCLWTCETNASSDRDKQLTITHEPCRLQPALVLPRSRWVLTLLRLQGQKRLTKRGLYHKQCSDNLMWHTCVTIRAL